MLAIRKVILENFRAYTGADNVLNISDFTAIIGKNDVGKSSWLEALSIFFDDKAGCKPDEKDVSVGVDVDSFSISVSFNIGDKKIIIDATNEVIAEDEYLLDSYKLLTIKKTYKNGKLTATTLCAEHPNSKDYDDLLQLTMPKLKERATKLKIDDETIKGFGQLTKAATYRKAIYENCEDLDIKTTEIALDKDESKKVWQSLEKMLPSYSLFKVDRNNTDQDKEAQDPFAVAMKNILAQDDVKLALGKLNGLVEKAYNEIASATMDELNEINPDIAKQLHPKFNDPKLDTAFKPNVTTDNGVPLNKRGSGVRRLVLLSFFCAEAKRKSSNSKGTIYAIEEPETSQHPRHQEILVKALQKISEKDESQVFITTHSPQLLSQVAYESVRYIQNIDDARVVTSSEDTLFDVVQDLGQLPYLHDKCLICVEGKNDISFLRNICSNIPELKSICDVSDYPFMDLGGGRLESWVKEHPLQLANLKEFHIYDNDVAKYKDAHDEINENWKNASAVMTTMHEIENYCHPDLINGEFGLQLAFDATWDSKDLPVLIEQSDSRDQKAIKQIICGSLSKQITKELLEAMGAWDEVKGWFEEINRLSIGGTE